MCKWGDDVIISLKIPADLSHTGEVHWKEVKIDACIAPIVDALQKSGIDMRWSCCGHGKTIGHIDLQDGRILVLEDKEWIKKMGYDGC